MVRSILKSLPLHLLLGASGLAPALAQGLELPPADGGNQESCRNHEGQGDCPCKDERESGSDTTGDGGCSGKSTLVGEGGAVEAYDGSYQHRIVDYQIHFGTSPAVCGGPAPRVDNPLHPPFVLEVTRSFRSRRRDVAMDWGVGAGWVLNYHYRLVIADAGGDGRSALLEYPSRRTMHWRDPNGSGSWQDASNGSQSMYLTLQDEPGDEHLVVDRWGGRFHFVPNVGGRPDLQYLCDWLEDQNGNRITLSYVDGYLSEASDGFGRSLRYTWSDGGGDWPVPRINRIDLPGGQAILLDYDTAEGHLVEITYPGGDRAQSGEAWDGDGDGHYYYFNDPRGRPGSRKDRVYTYVNALGEETGRVRGVKDETGHVKYVRREQPGTEDTRVYTDTGRDLLFEYPGLSGGQPPGLPAAVEDLHTGARHGQSWDVSSFLFETEEDALGNEYRFDYDETIGLPTREWYPDGTWQSWDYNAQNRLSMHRGREGFVTRYGYDAAGNLTEVVYPDGSVESWARDPSSGRILSATDPNGNTTSFEYGPYGNLSRVVLPADPDEPNPEILYTHDVHGRTTSITGPEGRVHTFEYDASQRLTRVVYPDGSYEQTLYGDMSSGDEEDPVGDSGLVVARRDRNGNWTYYEYGWDDRMTRRHGAVGEIEYAYDGRGRLVSETVNGDATFYAYDEAGRRSAVMRRPTEGEELITSYTYDLLDRVVEERDPYGFVTLREYDADGLVTSVSRQIADGDFATTSYEHDSTGKLIAVTDAEGRRRTYDHDWLGRVLRAYEPEPFEADYVEYAYDPDGNLVARRNQAGELTTYEYTARNALQSITDPVGNQVLMTYYLDDNVASITDVGRGARTELTYDCCSRVATSTRVVDGGAQDIVAEYEYDGNGNVVRRVDGEGFEWLMEYDERDRPVKLTDPLDASVMLEYFDDGSSFDDRLALGQGRTVRRTEAGGRSWVVVQDGIGRALSLIDPAGKARRYQRDVVLADEGPLVGTVLHDREGRPWSSYADGLGRTTRLVDPLSQTTTVRFDRVGNRTAATDALSHETQYRYDERDLLVETTLPDGGVIERTWTSSHRPASVTDQRGVVRRYAYDGAGRVLTEEYEVEGETYTDRFSYDLAGRMEAATSGLYGHVVRRTYDSVDRVLGESLDGRSTGFTYDRRSLPTITAAPSGISVQRTYTARGRLDTVGMDGDLLADLQHDLDGRLVEKLLGNGASTTLNYDQVGRIDTTAHASGGEDVLTFEHEYDDDGLLLRKRNLTSEERGEVLRYDPARRLVAWARRPVEAGGGAEGSGVPPERYPLRQQTWLLDTLGNWEQTTVDGRTESRLHNEVNELVERDGEELAYDEAGNLSDDGTFLYEHDPNGQLSAVRLASDGATVAEYTYDALGRRVSRRGADQGSGVQFFYVGRRVLEEYADGGERIATYAYGTYLDEPVARSTPSAEHYYHVDSLFDTVALTDGEGEVVERYEYDPYGGTTTYDASWSQPSSTSRVGNPYAFRGRRLDPKTGHYDFRARAYSPSLGRFLSRDPAGYVDGMNLYRAYFVPNGVDPTGRSAWIVLGQGEYENEATMKGFREAQTKTAENVKAGAEYVGQFSDKQFKKLVDAEQVTLNGEKWKGSKDAYIARISREKVQLIEADDSSLDALVKQLKDTVKQHVFDYDFTYYSGHTTRADYHVTFGTEPVHVDDVVSRFGKVDPDVGEFDHALCFSDAERREWRRVDVTVHAPPEATTSTFRMPVLYRRSAGGGVPCKRAVQAPRMKSSTLRPLRRRVAVHVSMRSTKSQPLRLWLPRLVLRQITAGRTACSAALLVGGTRSSWTNVHMAGSSSRIPRQIPGARQAPLSVPNSSSRRIRLRSSDAFRRNVERASAPSWTRCQWPKSSPAASTKQSPITSAPFPDSAIFWKSRIRWAQQTWRWPVSTQL